MRSALIALGLALVAAPQCVAADEVPTPSRIIPMRPLMFSSEAPRVPAELVGLDIEQDGHLIKDPVPQLHEGSPVSFRLFWRVLGALPEGLEVRVRLESSGPTRDERFAVPAAGWRIGGVYVHEFEVAIWRVYGSGRNTLWFSLPNGDEDALLYSMRVYIAPVPAASKIDAAQLAEAFGADAVRLNARFRLGVDAAVTLGVPDGAPPRVAAVGVVSSVAFKALFHEGDHVCSVIVYDADSGDPVTTYLVHGESTMQTDFETYRPEDVEKVKAPVFSETTEDEDAKKREYTGILDLGRPVRAAGIEMRYLMPEALLQVQEIVLIPAKEDR